MSSSDLAEKLAERPAPVGMLEKDGTPTAQSENGISAQRRGYIPTLDGWRAIAVSLVIGAHCYTMLLHNGSWLARHAALFVSHAGYGVDIFFALSGFLICTLLLREKGRTGTICLRRFYLRRAFRILPPMLLFLLSIILLSLFGRIPVLSLGEITAVLFFFRNYIQGTWYTGHFWSLAVEEQFYAVVPLFLLLLDKRWAARLASGLIVLCITVRCFEYTHGSFGDSLLQFRTENRSDGLLWGAMLALALNTATIQARLRKYLSIWVFLGSIAAAVVLLTSFPFPPVRRTIVAMVMPVLIGHTVLHAQGWVGTLLELPLLRWVGRISYSLYIWQMLFLPETGRPLGALQAFPLALVLPFVCASLSYYMVEKPLIRLGHRLAGAPGEIPTGRF
jgi:peptidoglycan/LPS O-acetylase OafA/YrhL